MSRSKASSYKRWYKRARVQRERAKVRECLAHGFWEWLQFEQCPWDEWEVD